MPTFTDASREVLSTVRSTYGDLLAALGQPARASELQATLSLDKKLAWRVQRLTATVDPLQAASFVPSSASANRVVRAAVAAGVKDTLGEAVLEATRAFERHVAERADDRSSFEAMAAAACGRGLDGILDDARRAAYRANVLIHGRSSDLIVFGLILAPGLEPGLLRAVSLRGHVGLSFLRPSASTEIGRHRFDEDGRPLASTRPLDPAAAERFGAPLLPEFGEPEAGQLHHVEREGCFRRTYLEGRDLGTRDASTFLLGECNDAFPLDPVACGSLCEIAVPARRLVHDVLIHEDVDLGVPELRTVSHRRETELWPEPGAPGVLPVDAHVADLGRGLASSELPEWPAHARLLARGVEALDVDPEALRLYRVTCAYPVLGSIVWLRARRGEAQ